MTDFVLTIFMCIFIGTFSYSLGKEIGREEMHRKEYVCQTTIADTVVCAKEKK